MKDVYPRLKALEKSKERRKVFIEAFLFALSLPLLYWIVVGISTL